MKKLISVFLVLGMILCLFTGMTFAEEYTDSSDEIAAIMAAEEATLLEAEENGLTSIPAEDGWIADAAEDADSDEESLETDSLLPEDVSMEEDEILLQASPTIDAEVTSVGVYFTFSTWNI